MRTGTISRIISHFSKDISNVVRWNHELSNRLCYLLGARRAIQLMLAVKDAAKYQYILLNVPSREKSLERVKKKVSSGIAQQGYNNEGYKDYKNVIRAEVKDRKRQKTAENVENLANKYILDEVAHRGLPQVILHRQASINASFGRDVTSGDIKSHPSIESGEEVVLLDLYYNVVAYGVSQMSSEEIKRSPGRVAIRVQEGRYDVLKYRNSKRYSNGLFSITTLPRVLGLQLMEFDKKKRVTLVVCQDNGEIAVEILNNSSEGSKVYLLIRNDNHFEAVKSTLKRLQVEQDAIEFIKEEPLDRFAKSRPKDKFTHFFLEMPSSETGVRPNPYTHLEEKAIIANARNQFSALRSVSLIGAKNAIVIYVTHSIDPTEGEEICVQGFRQGGFTPVKLDEKLRAEFSDENRALPEVPTLSSMGQIDLEKMIEEEQYEVSWLHVDPIKSGSDAGFVAKFKLSK